MKKTLQNIRQKSPEFRMTVAFVLAAVCTAGVAIFWGTTLSFRSDKPKAPSPFNVLVSSIKGTVSDTKRSANPNQTEIINADYANGTDESNPPIDITDMTPASETSASQNPSTAQ